MTNFVSNCVFTLPTPQQSSATTQNFANLSIFANCIFGHFLPDPVPLFAAAARTTAHTPHPLHKSPSAVFLNPRKQPQKRPCASISLTYCLCHLLPPVSRTLLPPHFHTPVLVSSKLLQSIFQIEQRTTSTHIKSTIKNHKLKALYSQPQCNWHTHTTPGSSFTLPSSCTLPAHVTSVSNRAVDVSHYRTRPKYCPGLLLLCPVNPSYFRENFSRPTNSQQHATSLI